MSELEDNKEKSRKILTYDEKKRNLLYSTIIESSPDAIISKNLEGKITTWNKGAETLYGYSESEVLNKSVLILFPEDKKDEIDIILEKIKKNVSIENYETVRINKRGERIHVSLTIIPLTDEMKNMIGVGIHARDITKKIQYRNIIEDSEKKVRESERKYRNILENIRECYFEIDLEGNFLIFNEAMEILLGYSFNELRGINYRQLFDKETQKNLLDIHDDLINQKGGYRIFEHEIIVKNGTIKYLETSIYLKREENEIVGFRGFSRDISKRKEIERLRKDFNDKLERQVVKRTKELENALEKQKLYLDQILRATQFKDKFLATMSHELRTPLNAIIGFSDILLEEFYGSLEQKQKEYLEDIHSSANDLLEMISHILDISKIETGQIKLNIKTFNLKQIVNQIKAALKVQYQQKNLYFLVSGLEKTKYIEGDPIRIKQILYNLLNNAIKFTEKGGVKLIIKEKRKNMKIIVCDTGIGIDKKDFNRIFQDFERGRTAHEKSIPGTGLGLSLTRRLVRLHKGKIYVESEPGKGSIFTVNIPKKTTYQDFDDNTEKDQYTK